jgi:hypothetical protein
MSNTRTSGTPTILQSLPEDSNLPMNHDPAMSFDEDTEDDKSLTGGSKPWDEGGASDCGYSDTVHTTLMKVGETIHTMFGAPKSQQIVSAQKSIGNWFQELSYATRDLIRGEHDSTLHKDTADAIHTVMTGGGLPEDDDHVSEPGEKKHDDY